MFGEKRWLAYGAAVALLLALAGSWWLGHARLQQMRAVFDTDGRIIHRLLSQRATADEAVLATLALLPPGERAPTHAVAQRLPALYPQVRTVWSRSADAVWPQPLRVELTTAESRSRASGHAELAAADLASGRYAVVLATPTGGDALLIDLKAASAFEDWPLDAATSPVRVVLEYAGQRYVVQPGQTGAGAPWIFVFHKPLASASQPLGVVLERGVRWRDLPWGWIVLWWLAVALSWAAAAAVWRARAMHRRTRELLQLGQVGRLNALGELAAGMAHELNQPLTAVLANTQAARRLLAEEPPELATARTAMDSAAAQARRAAGTLARLRRLVERPAHDAPLQAVRVVDAVRDALRLLEPECRKLGVQPRLDVMDGGATAVLADPVALQQVLHNLLVNALQALEAAPAARRALHVTCAAAAGKRVQLRISDSGSGVPPQVRAHLFEPFTTTKLGGLGLGLALCESLATSMGGALELLPQQGKGATFALTLNRALSERNDA